MELNSQEGLSDDQVTRTGDRQKFRSPLEKAKDQRIPDGHGLHPSKGSKLQENAEPGSDLFTSEFPVHDVPVKGLIHGHESVFGEAGH